MKDSLGLPIYSYFPLQQKKKKNQIKVVYTDLVMNFFTKFILKTNFKLAVHFLNKSWFLKHVELQNGFDTGSELTNFKTSFKLNLIVHEQILELVWNQFGKNQVSLEKVKGFGFKST